MNYTKKYNFLIVLFLFVIGDFMVSTTTEVKKWGNSFGVIIDRKTTKKLKLKEGQKISIDIVPREKISGFGITKGAKPFKRDRDDRKF